MAPRRTSRKRSKRSKTKGRKVSKRRNFRAALTRKRNTLSSNTMRESSLRYRSSVPIEEVLEESERQYQPPHQDQPHPVVPSSPPTRLPRPPQQPLGIHRPSVPASNRTAKYIEAPGSPSMSGEGFERFVRRVRKRSLDGWHDDARPSRFIRGRGTPPR